MTVSYVFTLNRFYIHILYNRVHIHTYTLYIIVIFPNNCVRSAVNGRRKGVCDIDTSNLTPSRYVTLSITVAFALIMRPLPPLHRCCEGLSASRHPESTVPEFCTLFGSANIRTLHERQYCIYRIEHKHIINIARRCTRMMLMRAPSRGMVTVCCMMMALAYGNRG